MKYNLTIAITLLFVSTSCLAQKVTIPAVHSNIKKEGDLLFVEHEDGKAYEVVYVDPPTLNAFRGKIAGTGKGLYFDFQNDKFNGTLIYGFIPKGDSKYAHTIFFKTTAKILGGRVAINIADILGGKYDAVGWQTTGKGMIGYRVVDPSGKIMYDGKISFTGTGPFKVDDSIIEGPFVNLLSSTSVTISFDTNTEIQALVKVNDTEFSAENGFHHEIELTGLSPATKYDYSVIVGENEYQYSLRTAPAPGSRTSFKFGYASDSRNGNGGGERNIHGANAYIVKKIVALGLQQDIKFMQFTGDLVNGYLTSTEEMDLQYANWKNTIAPFASYVPVIATMGNHEAMKRMFVEGKYKFEVDRFPYETESAEAVFARNFVNPLNGPDSEDGAVYDPRKKKVDFPSYKENVFYYTYDNIGMVVLNSDYWYAPSKATIPIVSGGLHGYIMDNQLQWLEETIAKLEADDNIDHIFVTQHTPAFPNGGHVHDDMWYHGNNEYRPYVAGEPLEKGIIERRDQYLDILVNKSKKTRAILTGDEHNYAKTELGPKTIIYDDKWELKKLELSRTIYQINNGAAGAPYYAQEKTPWSGSVTGFTTQNALVIFNVDGDKIYMEVLNPDTLEKVDELQMR